MANRASEISKISERRFVDGLLERERLGSTGMGNGVAIPHCRFEELDRVLGIFACTENPIDFSAADNEPVDIFFALFAPEKSNADHLKALARVSRMLRNRKLCEKLRAGNSADALYVLLTDEGDIS